MKQYYIVSICLLGIVGAVLAYVNTSSAKQAEAKWVNDLVGIWWTPEDQKWTIKRYAAGAKMIITDQEHLEEEFVFDQIKMEEQAILMATGENSYRFIPVADQDQLTVIISAADGSDSTLPPLQLTKEHE